MLNSQHGNIKEELVEPSSADRGDTSLRRSSRAWKQVVSYCEEDFVAGLKKKKRRVKIKERKEMIKCLRKRSYQKLEKEMI